jgi:hypothetical protein
MANLIANSQHSSFPAFAERKELAEAGTRFCIDSVKLHTQKDGKIRWYLTIRYLEDDGVAIRTLTFDPSPSRDEMFTALAESDDFPQHYCWVAKKSFKNKGTGMMQTFYELGQDTGKGQACACNLMSADVLEDEPVEPGEEVDPFLPDFPEDIP